MNKIAISSFKKEMLGRRRARVFYTSADIKREALIWYFARIHPYKQKRVLISVHSK